jgi:hypothetical protein
MKAKVYIETTIPSYLCARRSRDLIMAANQQMTEEWWDDRNQFDLYISALVIQEAGAGDPVAAQKRIEQLKDIPELGITDDVESFAGILIQKLPLPKKAKVDALHIAAATLNGMDYLLTWNCAHIANAVLRPKVEAICRELGYEPPTICTPQELMRYD